MAKSAKSEESDKLRKSIKSIYVWQDRVLVRIKVENIIAVATEKNYTKIFTPDKKFYFVRISLVKLLKKLPAEMFIKIHRSFAVATDRIDEVYKDHVVVDGQGVPVARPFYTKLIKRLDVIE